VRHGDAPELGPVRRRLEARPDLLLRGPTAIAYAIIDHVVDGYEPVVAGLETTSTRSRTRSSAAVRLSPVASISWLAR
jgi:Mg2+ and Co2+ transporter CorA